MRHLNASNAFFVLIKLNKIYSIVSLPSQWNRTNDSVSSHALWSSCLTSCVSFCSCWCCSYLSILFTCRNSRFWAHFFYLPHLIKICVCAHGSWECCYVCCSQTWRCKDFLPGKGDRNIRYIYLYLFFAVKNTSQRWICRWPVLNDNTESAHANVLWNEKSFKFTWMHYKIA